MPLRLLARLGFTAAAFSVLLGTYFFARLARRHPDAGRLGFGDVATVFFGGMSLVGIAIIGRYLSVIVEETPVARSGGAARGRRR